MSFRFRSSANQLELRAIQDRLRFGGIDSFRQHCEVVRIEGFGKWQYLRGQMDNLPLAGLNLYRLSSIWVGLSSTFWAH